MRKVKKNVDLGELFVEDLNFRDTGAHSPKLEKIRGERDKKVVLLTQGGR